MIRAFGGEVVLVDQAPGAVKGRVTGADLALVEEAAARIIRETGAFFLGQFENPDNARCQERTAQEIWDQSGGSIDVFADFIGTGGTFAGNARRFKSLRPDIRCYAVEPEGHAFYAGEDVSHAEGHRIQGGGYARAMALVDPSLIDGCVTVSDEEAMETAREIARIEGVFAGFSSGANVCAAMKLLAWKEKGSRIAVVINDCGLKYMSTDLY